MASSFYVTPKHRKEKELFFLHFLKHHMRSLFLADYVGKFSTISFYVLMDTQQ